MATTRHVWGKYTRQVETGYRTRYRDNADTTARGRYTVTLGEDVTSFQMGSGYTFSTTRGTYSRTGVRTYTWSLYDNVGSGYLDLVGDALVYSGGWQCSFSGSDNQLTSIYNYGYTLHTAESYRESYSYYVRGSLIGYVSSTNSGAYPSNDYTGSYWYVKQGSDNIDPVSVSIPEEVFGGETTTITVSPSTSKQYSGTVSYIYQYRFNGGDWNGLTTSTSTSATLAVPIGMNTVQVRVQAKDDLGFTSATWVESNTVEVINGDPPFIQWGFEDNPHDMGQITEPFEFNYTVQDPDLGNTMTVDESLTYQDEDKVITIASHTYENVNIGTEIKYDVLTSNIVNFQQCPTDDVSTIKISAVDNYGLQSQDYIVTFTKYIDEVTITLKTPLAVEGSITEAVIYVIGYIPSDAIFTMKATNNANDETPIWQDVTDDVLHRRVFKFDNLIAENGYAFNFELYAKRGESKEKGFIDEIMGAFK